MSVDAQSLPPLLDSCSELVEHAFGVFPVDASIRDADAVLQAGLALGRYLLSSCESVRRGTFQGEQRD